MATPPPVCVPGEASAELRKLTARPEAEDIALLIGLCTHRLTGYAEAGGNAGDDEREEVTPPLIPAPIQILPQASILFGLR